MKKKNKYPGEVNLFIKALDDRAEKTYNPKTDALYWKIISRRTTPEDLAGAEYITYSTAYEAVKIYYESGKILEVTTLGRG